MASIIRDSGGRKRIQFVDKTGNRKTIRLGKVALNTARQMKFRVEKLLEADLAALPLDRDMALWVGELPIETAKKLARAGLISMRKQNVAATLEVFIEEYISRRKDTSPNTRRIWRQTARRLVGRFGADRPLQEITRGDATDWRLSLISDGLADASVRKHCAFAKHFFSQAVDHELIARNPFGKLVSSPVGNESRQFFVSREAIAQVIAAAPSETWRLIIALSRFGGLRCPSEHFSLRWEDVHWDKKRLHITSPKTARHAGHESREIPLFPELLPFLKVAQEAADPDAVFVINTVQNTGSNIRTQMTRIVKRAGLKPWPRIFHNLRSSRQTELEEDYPSHVVCKWIGNSPQVARKHYLQLTDEHFERATQSGAKCDASEAQNAAQQVIVADGTASQSAANDVAQPLDSGEVTRQDATCVDATRNKKAEMHGNRTHRPHGLRTTQRF